MLTTIFTLLTTGAGGGIFGSIFGLFKQSQERKERVDMAKVEIQRDMMEYKNAQAERDHAMAMLNRRAELELQGVVIKSEAEQKLAEIDLAKSEQEIEGELLKANQNALSQAQEVFNNLKTTSGMDNYRASVRPSLAYWAATLFTVMLCWAFWKFASTITADEGKQILIGLFGTLTFTVTSVISFYYVSRRNSAPKL